MLSWFGAWRERLVAFFGFAIACFASPPASAGAPRLVWSQPAGNAVIAGERIVAWAPDLRSVLAYDATGKRLWRVATGERGGMRDLEFLPAGVIAYVGDAAWLLDPASGQVRGKADGVTLTIPGEANGCRIREHQGACAIECTCSFQVVRCSDLAPVGARTSLPMFETLGVRGVPMETHCSGSPGLLLGRAGDVVVAAIPMPALRPKPFSFEPLSLIGLDAGNGKVLWRRDKSAIESHDVSGLGALHGIAGDGASGYFMTRDGHLEVFDAKNGEVRWTRATQLPHARAAQVEAPATASHLIVRDGLSAKYLALPGGAEAGSVPLAADAVFVAGPIATYARRPAGAHALVVLDPERAAVRAQIALPGDDGPMPMRWADRYVLAHDHVITVFGAQGDALGPGPIDATSSVLELVAGPDALVYRSAEGLTLHRPAGGTDEAWHEPGLMPMAVGGFLGRDKVLVFRPGARAWDPEEPDSFGELRLVRFPAAPKADPAPPAP